MPELEAIAYHGWGFNPSFWKPWQKWIPDFLQWKNYDRGYFGEPGEPHFSSGSRAKIILTHSFGLHLCSDRALMQADALLIFGGFLSFHPQAAQFRRRSRLVVNEMMKQFGNSPEKVLEAFYRNVYHPEKSYERPPAEMNAALLLEDLNRLNESKQSLPELKKEVKIFIFQGAEDAIVPKRKGRALYEMLGPQAQYFEIKKAGHALPVTHAAKCWHMVEAEIMQL
jgi:pimeloyl-[acyl-carrier protein] methyl ester esterase